MAKQKKTRIEAKSFGGTIEVTREERMVPHSAGGEWAVDGLKVTVVDANGSVASVWLIPGEARELAKMVRM